MFKKGDKIVRVKGNDGNGMLKGNTYTVKNCDADNVIVDEIPNESWSPQYFKPAENQFSVTRDAWYIRVNSPEESKAAQDWLFSQGCSWGVGEKEYRHTGEKSLTNDNGGARLFWGSQASVESKQEKGVPEIKLTFKTQTVVDKVVLPVVESPQQKQIRELEETIQKATQQIEQLKKGL